MWYTAIEWITCIQSKQQHTVIIHRSVITDKLLLRVNKGATPFLRKVIPMRNYCCVSPHHECA